MWARAAEFSKLVVWRRKSSIRPGPSGFGRPSTVRFQRKTSLPGSWNGSGRSSAALTTLKIAVLAPLPSASVSTATAAKPGAFVRPRQAYATSCPKSVQMPEFMNLGRTASAAVGRNGPCSTTSRDSRPLVQERRHLLPQRRNLHRLERRRRRRLHGTDRQARLYRRPRRHVHLAAAVLPLAEQ